MNINEHAKWLFVGIYAMAFTLAAVSRATIMDALGCIFVLTGVYCITMSHLLTSRQVEPSRMAGHSALAQALQGAGCLSFGSVMLLEGALPSWASWSLSISCLALSLTGLFLERRSLAR